MARFRLKLSKTKKYIYLYYDDSLFLDDDLTLEVMLQRRLYKHTSKSTPWKLKLNFPWIESIAGFDWKLDIVGGNAVFQNLGNVEIKTGRFLTSKYI